MFKKQGQAPAQEQFWVEAKALPPATPNPFYQRVEETLAKMNFAQEVWAICTPAYAASAKGGRPGIDPVIYLKMLMVGFFENLPSERAIASRCADSFSIRGFLGYAITERTPDHSSLSVIRYRLGTEAFQEIHLILLRALRAHGLLRGRQLGIDSSVMEANASLRALESRNTAESYWEYVRGLAAQAGIDPGDVKAVRRFDKQRPGRKTSNRDWVNPYDVQAKIGRTKDGATDMIYKPEHVADLESGAIISAEVRLGDAADCPGAADRVLEAIDVMVEAAQADGTTLGEMGKLGGELVADEGYFAVEEMGQLQGCGVRTIVGDPHAGRRSAEAAPSDKRALRRARAAVESASGKALLRKRGQHVERAFCHILDQGGLRRATLKGCENLSKRYLMGAFSYNLSLLLRTLFGVGTSKQWLAAPRWVVLALLEGLRSFLTSPGRVWKDLSRPTRVFFLEPSRLTLRLTCS